MKKHDTSVLAAMIEESVKSRGISPEAVWLDKHSSLENGLRRCEAIFRMIGAQQNFNILDVGCGPGLALAYLQDRYGRLDGRYYGIDVSEALITLARQLWPGHEFQVRDIIADPLPEKAYDFTAINGVLTAKYTLSHDDMENFVTDLLQAAWKSTAAALSFNVMSTHVDWTRDDLFHWPMDQAATFCMAKLSRHINLMADYGLYEYTVQVFREPYPLGEIPLAWQRLSKT